jgi:hypothetical protein
MVRNLVRRHLNAITGHPRAHIGHDPATPKTSRVKIFKTGSTSNKGGGADPETKEMGGVGGREKGGVEKST